MATRAASVDVLERLAVQLQGITEAAQQMREIDSFEDLRDNLKVQAEKAKQELADTLVTLGAKRQERDLAEKQAANMTTEATAAAAQVVNEAKAKAAGIIKAASEQAALDLKAAKDGQADALKVVNASIDAANVKLKAVQASTAKAVTEAEAVERRAAEAQASLEKVQAAARALIG